MLFPVCAPQTARRLADIADSVVCLESPESFGAVGAWYENFSQTTDEEVLALLQDDTGTDAADTCL